MNRIKNFDSTGIATNGRLYAGDLNAIQDAAAALTDLTQNLSVGTLAIGESGLSFVHYGAGEARLTGMLRTDGILRGLGGLFAGTFTTTARDSIALGSRPYGLEILNTTTNRREWNSGTDAAPVWRPVAVDGAGSLPVTGMITTTGGGANTWGFTYNPATAVGTPFVSTVGAEANPRFYVNVLGAMVWGAGGATAPDLNFYRFSAGNLRTDQSFTAGVNVTAIGQLMSNTTVLSYNGAAAISQVVLGINGSNAANVQIGTGGSFFVAGSGLLSTGASLGIQVTPGFSLDAVGAVHGTSFPVSSDKRLKTKVKSLDSSLDKLLRVRGVSFVWRKDHGTHRDYTVDANREITERQIGVIAQDVLAEFPEIVHQWPVFKQEYDAEQDATVSVETGETRYAVDYGRMVPILIEAIRELREEVKTLEQRIQ